MNLDYKEGIEESRKGSLGGSDATMLANIANIGYVPKSAHKRLAICKGLIEREDFTSPAMRFGDYIENTIFDLLKEKYPTLQSNPLWVSKKYSKPNVRLICHPDYVWVDEKNKALHIFECKATKDTFEATRAKYIAQMFVEYTLGTEVAKELGLDGVYIHLVHYRTLGIDLNASWEFDADLLTIKKVRINKVFNIESAMNIVAAFLADFDHYYTEDEVDGNLLPENVRKQFDAITTALSEIKEREETIKEFKARLLGFMQEHSIKSVKCDAFNVVRVDEATSRSFDYKKYLADLSEQHPRKAKKIIADYTKETKKSAFVTIKVK